MCVILFAYFILIVITVNNPNTTQYLPHDHGASHFYSYKNAFHIARILHAIIAYNITIIVEINLSSFSAISMLLMNV